MGRLFGKDKERKESNLDAAANVDDFLRTSMDSLEVSHPPPPPQTSSLPKLDTSISRYPQAHTVNSNAQVTRVPVPGRASSQSPRKPRPNRKGQLVSFSNQRPEIIGEGGDECEYPVIEISRSKQRRTPQPPAQQFQTSPSKQAQANASHMDDFQPKPISRTQTGFSSIGELPPSNIPSEPPEISPLSPQSLNLLPVRGIIPSAPDEESASRTDKRRSFIEIQSAQMRQAEGKAFAKAVRTSSVAYAGNWEDGAPPGMSHIPAANASQLPQPQQLPQTQPPQPAQPAPIVITQGDSGTVPADPRGPGIQQNPVEPPISRQASTISNMGYSQLNSRMGSVRLQDSTNDDSLQLFVTRTTHLYELFRLHAETLKPIPNTTPEEAVRASLWWFLKGRTGLEASVRERPSTPQSQMQNDMDRQQAYTNLAKSYWLSEVMIPELMHLHGLQPSPQVDSVRQQVLSSLTKLCMSMKRNGFLPPEEQFLPQTLDKFIWIEYPQVNQDMIPLLSGNWGSGMSAMQQPLVTLQLMDAFPLGDSAEHFSYGRINVDVYLMEQDRGSQQLHFPCLLSMVRPQRDMGLIFVLASQNGIIQMAIQDSRGGGPTWKDVRWRNEQCCLELRLPRGFLLAIQMNQQDYRTLWNMYDYGAKVRSALVPRNGESMVFQNTIRSFQYIDADPQSRAFPKDAVQFCDVALFEKIKKINGPTGPRSFHAGCRIAAVTGARTRTLSSVSHSYSPGMPIQFGFFRGENQLPALSVKFDDGRHRGRMVLVFADDKERIRFHSLLTGTDLDAEERIFSNVPLKNYMISQSIREPRGMAPFDGLPWNAARVVNEECGPSGEPPSTVMAEKLKIVLEYQNGTITDRINVAPGELRLRLDASAPCSIRLMRQAQQDITMACLETPGVTDQPSRMTDALALIHANQTIRTLEFNTIKDLHSFQAAVTGFDVIFDGLAASFAIARRRMVVSIHKKWEATGSRIQIVRNEDNQVQLLAFFEDFQHGYCMNFVLKGTDVFESLSKSGKTGVKIVDAKFPLPRVPEDKNADFDDMAFVCLDLPDLPGEHDDISILFEKEAGEHDFFNCCGVTKLTRSIRS